METSAKIATVTLVFLNLRHGMEEKAYKTMGKTGAFNLVLGICTMVAGIAVGVVMIIHGAKLLGSRKNIMF